MRHRSRGSVSAPRSPARGRPRLLRVHVAESGISIFGSSAWRSAATDAAALSASVCVKATTAFDQQRRTELIKPVQTVIKVVARLKRLKASCALRRRNKTARRKRAPVNREKRAGKVSASKHSPRRQSPAYTPRRIKALTAANNAAPSTPGRRRAMMARRELPQREEPGPVAGGMIPR